MMKTLICMLTFMLIMTSMPIPSMYTSVTAATLSWGNVGDGSISEVYSYNPVLSEDSNGVLHAMFQDSMSGEFVVKNLAGNSWADAGKAEVSTGPYHFAMSRQNKAFAVYVDYDHGSKASVIEITPSSWSYVGAAGFSDHAVKAPRLVFNGDTPYAAYIDGSFGSQQAIVMKYNGITWETIGELPGAADQIELKVDITGSVYATFIDEGAGRSLSTMKYSGVSWEYVGSRGFTNEEVNTFDVAVTATSVPVVAYTDTNDQAVASLYDGSQWTIIGNKGFTDGGVLDLDIEATSNHDLYLLYKDAVTKKANVFMKRGTNWETLGTKNFSNGEIYHLFLMIGSSNKPYVAYSSAANAFRVKVATLMTTYSVTYHDNGADSGDLPINDNVYTEGELVTIEGNWYDLKKEDHYFDGWTLTPSPVVTDSVYYSWDELRIGQEDVHLYANWKLNPPTDKPTLEASAGDGSAELTWNAIDRASYYNIYVKSEETDYSYTWLDNTMELTYTAEGLVNDSVYYFLIEPANGNGAGDCLSNAVKIIPLSAEQPTLPYVSIASNSSTDPIARRGNTIALTFVSSHKLSSLPVVTIAGQAAVVTNNGNQRYTAAYTLSGVESIGEITFTIDFVSVAGKAGKQVTLTTDGSNLTYSNSPTEIPVLSGVVGDGSVLLSWSEAEGATRYHVFMKDPQKDVQYEQMATVTESTYEVTGLTNSLPYYFKVEAANDDGTSMPSNEIRLIPLSLAVPVLPYVSIAGSGSSRTYVSKGDDITLTFVSSLQLKQLPIVTIAGQTASVADDGNQRFTAAYTLDGSEDRGELKFSVDVISEAGIAGEQVTSTTDGSKLIHGSPPSSGGSVVPPSNEQQIDAEIVDPSGASLFEAAIKRTTDASGKRRDEVTIAMEEAEAITKQLVEAKRRTAKLVLPDKKDEVYAAHVLLTKDAAEKLREQEIDLEIDTKHAIIRIPQQSLTERDDDIYFRIAPMRDSGKQQEVMTRAGANEAVIQAVGPGGISLLGRPVIIETNMQKTPVDLVLPIDIDDISGAAEQDIAIYIEHSDGSKQWLQGKLVNIDGTDRQGIAFTVNKFSTFSLVYGHQLQDYFIEEQAHAPRHAAYMNGYDDGLFQPDKQVTRAEMAVMLSRALELGEAKNGKVFTDMKHDHWAKEAIAQVSAAGLMSGYGDGSFMPMKPMTRAEMASIITRYIKEAEESDGQHFNDTRGHWAAAAILKAQAAGIIAGYDDGTFRPDQSLTRAQAVMMINRLVGRGPLYGMEPKWKDVPISHWAFHYIQEASIDHSYERLDNGGEKHVEET
ncbi:S-layer homology domain-containing protein [Paenibacillus sp. J5C_2022]|nr:S-layer homology domain-containing protein [Paenibacillus sp. J5C2022]